MFTTIDKALVAAIMGVLSLINILTPFHFGIDPNTVTVIVGLVTPFLVHAMPNKPVVPQP